MVKVVSILSDIKLVLRPVETETASWAMNIVLARECQPYRLC
jgi:hypothetical protein